MKYTQRILKIFARDPFKMWGALRVRTGLEHKLLKYYKRTDGYSGWPLTIAVRLSYRCNLRCLQCGQWGTQGIFKNIDPNSLAKEELSTNDLKRFIDEVAGFKPYIYFTGGEPLLRDDVFDIIEYASKRHIVTSMSTNGTLLRGKSEKLIKSGLDYLYTSLDATDDLNTKIRRGQDSFQKTSEGIKEVLKLRDEMGVGLPLVQIQTIILKENQDRLFQIGQYLEKNLCPDVWGLQLCVYTTPKAYAMACKVFKDEYGIEPIHWKGFIQDSTKNADHCILESQLQKIKANDWKFRLRLYVPLEEQGFNFKDYFQNPKKTFVDYPCLYPWAFAQLQPDGGVAFCGSQPDYIIGNIRDDDFKNIWNNTKARTFRKNIQKNPLPVCCRCFGLHIFSKYK
jgi:radical SAM protein with 4Fe4S-binding SPASM domain